jgi:hypothetical protein
MRGNTEVSRKEIAIGFSLAMVLALGFGLRHARAAQAGTAPVLVELFTSEGCSSCPPADDLLAQIEKKIPNAVVLSEHVTYWNNGGWHDPFSSDESTARQADYVQRMGLDSSYTPQMVVGGRYEFVGSDGHAAAQAIARASNEPVVPINIDNPSVGAGGRVSFALRTGAVKPGAQLFVVVAQDEGSKHVSNGENGGHTLRHVQIARSFQQVARIKAGDSYSGHLTVTLPEAIACSGWHLVAFLEQGRGGPMIGAASAAIPGSSSPTAISGN